MKSILKKAVVIVFLFSASVSLANNAKASLGKNKVEKNIENPIVEPTFRKKRNNMLLVSLLNLTKKEVIIKVINNDGVIVYKESIKGEVIVEKALNFREADLGKYTIVVVDNYGTYKETLVVK